MPEQLDALRAVLTAELPITQHLAISVAHADERELSLALPLGPNRNHQGTMFAGSLNAVATLTGWAMLWLLLRRHQLTAVPLIQDSSIEYLRPVHADCLTRCPWPAAAAVSAFVSTVRRRGRARIPLELTLESAGAIVGRFRGRYVALAEPRGR